MNNHPNEIDGLILEFDAARIFFAEEEEEEEEEVNVVVSLKDISERKQYEKEILYERYLFQTLLDNILDTIYFKDRNARFIHMSKSLADLFNTTPQNAIGKTDFSFFHKDLAEKKFKDDTDVILSGKPIINKEEIDNTIEGKERWVSTTKLPWFDKDGTIVGMLGISRDITAQKKVENDLKKSYLQLKETQNQLIQAEKLTAVGQLASGIAHEVRNPLGIIIQGINYLEEKLSSKNENTIEVLGMIKDNVKRADKIIGALLDFSRISGINLQPTDINSVLENSLILVKPQFIKNIDIIKEIKKGIPKVLIDKNMIEQVFLNIFLNAIQAMPEGGKIIIHSYYKDLKKVKNSIGRTEEDRFKAGEKAVVVEIKDTGIGIPKENLNRIFDPFFTTKGPSGGTGIGLSISQKIIDMHKALIEVRSQVGKGTNVIITFKTAGE